MSIGAVRAANEDWSSLGFSKGGWFWGGSGVGVGDGLCLCCLCVSVLVSFSR